MRYEIPFNTELRKRQLRLNFDEQAKKSMQRIRKGFAYGILFIILSLIAHNGSEFLFFMCFMTGYSFFFIYGYYYLSQKRNEKKYFENAQAQDDLESGKSHFFWEFTETHFSYLGNVIEVKLNWAALTSFKIMSQTLFLTFAVANTVYLLSEEEVGSEEFQKIIAFVKTKAPNTDVNQ